MRIRYARLVAALTTTTVLGIGAAEIAANLTAQDEVRRLVERHKGLSIGGVYAEALSGRLVLRDVRAGRQVSIGRLDLPLPNSGFGLVSSANASPFDDKPEEPAPPAPAAPETPAPQTPAPAAPQPPVAAAPAGVPGTASAENVVIRNGKKTVTIKRIDLAGTTLSNADLAAFFDAANTEKFEARLRKLNATSIIVLEIVADDATPGSEEHSVFTQLAFSNVTSGKAAAMSIAGFSTEGTTKDNGKTSGTIGPIQAAGIDFAQIAHIFEATRASEAEPILPLFDSASITSMKFVDAKGGGFSLALLQETNVKGRALKPEIVDLLESDNKKMTDAENMAVLKDLGRSFEVGSIGLVDFDVRGDNAKELKTLKLGRFAFRGYAKARIGGFSMTDFRLENDDVNMGIGGVEIGAFDVPLPKASVDGKPEQAMVMSANGKADVNDIDFDVAEKAKAPGEPPTRVRFKVRHVGFRTEGAANELPASSKLAIDNVGFDVPKDPQAAALIDMGYSHIDLSAAIKATYDEPRQNLKINEFSVQGVDMGSVALGVEFINVTKGIASQDKEVVKASMLAVLVKAMSLDVQNRGLVDRALAWKAKQDATSVDKEKAALIDYFDKQLPAALNSANVKIVGSAIAKFIANPKALHIGVVSKSGLGVGSMGMLNDPALLIDSLDVKATAD